MCGNVDCTLKLLCMAYNFRKRITYVQIRSKKNNNNNYDLTDIECFITLISGRNSNTRSFYWAPERPENRLFSVRWESFTERDTRSSRDCNIKSNWTNFCVFQEVPFWLMKPGVIAIKQTYGSNLRKNHSKLMSGALKLNKIEKNHFTEN